MSKELIILIIFVSVVIFVVTFDFIWSNTKTWLKVSSKKSYQRFFPCGIILSIFFGR